MMKDVLNFFTGKGGKEVNKKWYMDNEQDARNRWIFFSLFCCFLLFAILFFTSMALLQTNRDPVLTK